MQDIDFCCVRCSLSQFACAGSSSKPTLSDTPLTAEQMAIYRVVIWEYTKGSNRVLNLANVTEPLEASEDEDACLKGFKRANKDSARVVHHIGPALIGHVRVSLVDPERHDQTVQENDPENQILKTAEDGQRVTDEQLDASLKKAFGSGIFTLSEIAFDAQHRRAAVSYSFHCGRLCGNGHTLILREIDVNQWKVVSRCGGWVS